MRIRDSLHDDRLPDTYYKPTCNDLEPFRRLEGNVRAQVCIIGGGFTGVATAVELAERGYSVALVEQNLIGWGASGRSGGQILTGPTNFARYETSFGTENAQAAWAMSIEGAQIIRERVNKYDIDCDLKWGGIEIARTVSENAGLQAKAASLKLYHQSADLEYLDRENVQNYVRSERVTSGLLRKDWGRCHPLNLVRSEARVAEKLGVKVFEDARVNAIKYGDSIAIDTGHGKVTADQIVLAGNAYLWDLVPQIAEKFTTVGTYLMVTKPVEDEIARSLLPQNSMVRGQGDTPLYFHLTPDNRVIFGSLNSYSGKHPKNLEKVLTQKLHSSIPELADAMCDKAWGGYIGVGEANIPQLGMLSDNVFYAQAYSGRGLADAHLAGRLIGEAFDGNVDRFNILKDIEHSTCKREGFLKRSIGAFNGMLSFVGKS